MIGEEITKVKYDKIINSTTEFSDPKTVGETLFNRMTFLTSTKSGLFEVKS